MSTIRITGMATGMDTDALVKELMKAKRVPIDRLKQDQTKLEWTRDAYRDMNTLMSQFRDAANNLRFEYQLKTPKATSDNQSLSVTSTTKAMNGSYRIDVLQLAAAAKASSNGTVSGSAVAATSASVLSVNGVDITVGANSKVTDVVTAINANKTATGVSAQYDNGTQKVYLTNAKTGEASEINLSVKSGDANLLQNLGLSGPKYVASTAPVPSGLGGTLTINGTDFTIDPVFTMDDVVTMINSKTADTNVTAKFDSTSRQLKLEIADPAGAYSSISTGGSLASAYSLSQFSAHGQDAKVRFDGGAETYSYASNSFSYRDMNVTLGQPQAGSTPSGGVLYSANINVAQDVDKVYNNIKAFVDKYNEVIDKVYSKVNEQKYRDFTPLTDDQKNAMTDNEVTLWEAKAKSGLLKSDSTLSGSLDKFRSLFSQSITGLPAGNFNSLDDIGISTAQPGQTDDKGKITSYKDHGKLYIDETKLKEAIANNPDQVVQVFTKFGTGSTQEEIDRNSGFAERIYDFLNRKSGIVDKLTDLAGVAGNTDDVTSSYALQIREIAKRIDEKTSLLADYEQQYYSQFAKLEMAIDKANKQGAQLSSYFGGGAM